MTLRTIMAAALLLFSCAGLADETAEVMVRHYVGSIGTHSVFASIDIEKGVISGRYAYGRIPYEGSEWLDLRGTVAPDGTVAIDEISSISVGERQDQIPIVSGRFSGQIDAPLSRITGTWSVPRTGKGDELKPLPFVLSQFSTTVAWGPGPKNKIGLLELLDTKLDVPRFANALVRAHASRLFSESKSAPGGACCDYAPTFYSSQLVSILFTGSRDGDPFHEGLVVGVKDGKPAQLAIGDVLQVDASWPKRFDVLVKKLHHATLDCPYQLNGFAITDGGMLRLFVGCKRGTGTFKEQDLPVPTRDLARLILPNGPAASVLRAGK